MKLDLNSLDATSYAGICATYFRLECDWGERAREFIFRNLPDDEAGGSPDALELEAEFTRRNQDLRNALERARRDYQTAQAWMDECKLDLQQESNEINKRIANRKLV